MFYDGFAVVMIFVGLLLLYFSARLLRRQHWFMGWLRGMMGLMLASAAVVCALIASDIYSYKQLLSEKSIATLSFERLAEQKYRAVLVNDKGHEQRFDLSGDQWQLDARIVKWNGFMAGMGIKPVYRLDRLSGRYYSLDSERNAERSVYALDKSELGVDVWHWLHTYTPELPWVDAVYGSAAFVPMEDGALYEVTLSHTGLLARPLNERAQSAVNRWQ